METIRGKQTFLIHATELREKINRYSQFWLDIGTGDGRFVLHSARIHRDVFVAGVDACRENLVAVSRRAEPNALFIIANALTLPPELNGLASRLTINFPWGSLLEGLLNADSGLLLSLCSAARPGAQINVRLNQSALTEAGWTLDEGARQVHAVLESVGFQARTSKLVAADLKACPSTWARKLAFGRSPYAMILNGRLMV